MCFGVHRRYLRLIITSGFSLALLSTEGAVQNGNFIYSKAYFKQISPLLCNIVMILSIYAKNIPAVPNLLQSLSVQKSQIASLNCLRPVTVLLLFN